MNSFIEALNRWGESFLHFAWPMFWQSSLLIVVLFGFEHLFRRKVRASIRYALWLVLLVKLCVPPTLALPTSPAWWLYKAPPAVAAKPPQHYTVSYEEGPLTEMPQTPLPTFVPPKPTLTIAAWLLAISAVMSLTLLGWLLVRWWQITRQVHRTKTSARLTALAGEAKKIINTKLKVQAKLTTNSMSPAVCGLFRPAILIPQSIVDNFSDEQLRAVLLHELIHLRRRDVWLNFVQALLQIFYWWHPLVWLANARIRRVREEAVDDDVMLALRDEAESYAPTLLEVAKLALNRPLASLGLVGILESRHALRQRIERLLDFRPPRQAGLTLVSLFGILAFTVVAVPMGSAPSPVELQTLPAPAAIADENTNTDTTKITGILSDPNFRAVLHALEQRNGTDLLPEPEVTTTSGHAVNRIRTDNISAPMGLSATTLSVGQNTNQPSVLITGFIYQMRNVDFEKIVSGLKFNPAGPGLDSWWSASPEKFSQLVENLKSSGLQPITRPRVQTWSGMRAAMYVGNGTNGIEFDYTPLVGGRMIDLTIQGKVIDAKGNETVTNQFNAKTSVDNYGGIVIHTKNLDDSDENNVVVITGVQLVTNSLSTKTGANTVDKKIEAGQFVQDAKLDYEMGKLDAAERLLKSALLVDAENNAAKYYLGLVQSARQTPRVIKTNEGRQEIIQKLKTIRLDSVVFEAVPLGGIVRILHEQSKILDPDRRGINFMINPNPDQIAAPIIDPLTGLPTTNRAVIDSGLTLTPITINPPLTNISLGDVLDALVLVAPEPIHYSIEDYAIVFSAGKPPTPFYSRHFRVGTNTFVSALKARTGSATNSVSQMASIYFSKIGVDLNVPGKSAFFNDRLGELFVRATSSDLDKIEQSIVEMPHSDEPQIHIKARFLEVPKGTLDGLALATNVTNQAVQSNQVAGLVGILTDKNFRTLLHNLEARPGVETLAEPEVVTTSGRQTQIRATLVRSMVTNFVFQETSTNSAIFPQMGTIETGPVLDEAASVLPDGYMIDLKTTASLMEFVGYDTPTNSTIAYNSKGEKIDLPKVLPRFREQYATAHLQLWDNQTVVLGKFEDHSTVGGVPPDGVMVGPKPGVIDKQLLVFITVTIVDSAGNRIHADTDAPADYYDDVGPKGQGGTRTQ
jgi:beta-lactamase regulating signal transducer with metallopeptidase domain